jgi:hypothetical protein
VRLNGIPNRYGKCLIKGHSYIKMCAFEVRQEEEGEEGEEEEEET